MIRGEVVTLPIGSVEANPWNPNRMTKHVFASLVHGLQTDGWLKNQALLVWKSPSGKHLIVDGEHRWKAAQELGFTECPAVVLDDISERKAKELTIAMNQKRGDWDDEGLAELVHSISEGIPKFDLALPLGLAVEDIDALMSRFDFTPAPPQDAPAPEAEEQPEPPAIPVELGQLWAIGPHRLYIGDSTDAKVWETVLQGRPVDLLLTDPPYGVDYGVPQSSATRRDKMLKRNKQHTVIKNDGAKDLGEFLAKVFAHANAHLKPGGASYVFSSATDKLHDVGTALRAFGLWRHLLAWKKAKFVLGLTDYHYDWEAVFYGWKEGAPHYFLADRTQTTTLECPTPAKSDIHPTMKPVPLLARLIQNSSKLGELVFDPFSGSGSSLLAAAQERRVFAGIELDTTYAGRSLARIQAALQVTPVRL